MIREYYISVGLNAMYFGKRPTFRKKTFRLNLHGTNVIIKVGSQQEADGN
jgi:hypothetical protein